MRKDLWMGFAVKGLARAFYFPMQVFAMLLLCLFIVSPAMSAVRTVRVGLYDNPPKLERGDGGRPRGLFIDILENIARKEGWDIRYVPGSWEEGLERLKEGGIDLMPDVAFSEDRSRYYDFNQIPVLSSWLQVFVRKGVSLDSVDGLRGKTIAVLKGSIQQQALEDISRRFGLTFRQVVLPDYDETIRYVESGKADAVIAGRFYGYKRDKGESLAPTSLIFMPTTLRFAVPKGRNRDLLDAIDRHLTALQNDPRSEYYSSLSRWLSEEPRMFVPRLVLGAVAVSIIAFLFFLGLSLILKRQVRKRTRELHDKNQALSDALAELKAAQSEAIKRERLYVMGQLASGLAHDFNNLLVPIISYTDLLLMDVRKFDEGGKTREDLMAIKKAALHGAEIVRHMRHFYRYNRSPEARERIDLSTVVREVILLAKARWQGRGSSGDSPVEVVFHLDEDAGIIGSRYEIHEMLLNLVLNAADALPQGGVIEISTECRNDEVALIVRDNGEGMTEEVREKCLEPFYTTKDARGTGMGLTMVQNIVEEHGGRLEIASVLGRGTSVVMRFPTASQCGGDAVKADGSAGSAIV